MARVGAYVFVSHASADNARLRPVVLALLEARVPLWLDKPADPGLDLSQSHFVGSIHKSDPWKTVVNRAIADSCATLVFPSEAAARAEEVRRETQRALAMMEQDADRYCVLPAFLSRMDEPFDVDVTGGLQGFNAWVQEDEDGTFRIAPGAEPDIARLAQFLNGRVAAANARSLTVEAAKLPADYHIPYLVNRSRQRDTVIASAHEHAAPILVVTGRPEDEMGRFLSATLVRRVLPAVPRATCTAESLQILRVRWPTATVTDASGFAKALVANLSERFQLDSRVMRDRADDTLERQMQRLASAFADNGVCRIVAARVPFSPRDRSGIHSAIKAWHLFWSEFPLDVSNGAALTLLPVLEILLDPAAPPSQTWLDRFRASLNRAAPGPRSVSLCMIPKLTDVTIQCAREWVETDLLFASQPDGPRERLADEFANLFSAHAGAVAMPMKTWATSASPLLLEAGYE